MHCITTRKTEPWRILNPEKKCVFQRCGELVMDGEILA